MGKLEVFVDRMLKDGRFVVTNNSESGIPIGTIFTSLQSRRALLEGEAFRSESLAPYESIELEVLEVDIFRKQVPEIPRGWSAAIKLQGAGFELVTRHLEAKQRSVSVFLITDYSVA